MTMHAIDPGLACASDRLPRVLLAASECAPLCKTGGLALMVGALAEQLQKQGAEVSVILPLHRQIKDSLLPRQHLTDFYLKFGWRNIYVGLEKAEINGLTYYFVDNDDYFGCEIYCGGEKEGEQYGFFSRAVIELLPYLDFRPDLVHCNDWHTAMIPMLVRTQYADRPQAELKYLLTVHNAAFRGDFSRTFAADFMNIEPYWMTQDLLNADGYLSFLKCGCKYADCVNTVSPTYALELLTPEYGCGLEHILAGRPTVSGILNGLDPTVYDPENDTDLPAAYSKDDLTGKQVCKRSLQTRLCLEQNDDVPIFSMVSRFTEQKGFELLLCVLDELMQRQRFQLVLIGSGEERFENFLRAAEQRYPGRLCACIGHNDELARLIYAGSDYYLMPSRFEPCGIGQMIAMRYGTLPIVRQTGGLIDTVPVYEQDEREAAGFGFSDYDAWELRDAIRRAISLYPDAELRSHMVRNAMSLDYGISHTAEEYIALYRSVTEQQ